MKNDKVNLFFACDDGYVPFLAVTLESIRKNRDKNREYDIRILHTGISEHLISKITDKLPDENFNIEFCDISNSVAQISERLHTRDYYSKSTYFRLFIPELYQELDRALYLDCDLVLCDDVSTLYDTVLGDNLVAAAADGFVSSVEPLHEYVTKRVGVSCPSDYFNAGVLLMNLCAMRNFNFEKKFIDLLGKVKFDVAQDQDYLNAICKGRRTVLSQSWNCMPGFYKECVKPKLIHYNLDSKPWHKDGVEFSDIFWSYSDNSLFAKEIRDIQKSYVETEKSIAETLSLINLAKTQAENEAENSKIQKRIAAVCG